MKTKVYGYARVSTSDQDNSLEVQKKRIEEYCTFKHLELVDVYVDENISGYKEFDSRPEGSKLATLLGKDVNAVVCVKPDRLFRNTVDALTTVDRWDSKGIELHVIDMGGATLATKTAMGKMIFTVLIAFSQFERDITGERTSAVLTNKKESGKAYAGQVFGYDKVGGELVNGKIKNKELIPNEKEQAIIAEIFSLSKNHSDYMIAKTLNERGVRTKNGKFFVPATIKAILGNSIHCKVA